jgi:predicted hotdog family 3-hydroxylacyl-ACP dehydratase
MVLLDEMADWAPGRAACRMVVREQAPFVVDGELGTSMTIEHMAQAVAACLGYEAFQGGVGVRVGMIIACKRFEALVPALDVGDELVIAVERIRGNETLSHFDCHVDRRAAGSSHFKRAASATLTLFHAERPPGA